MFYLINSPNSIFFHSNLAFYPVFKPFPIVGISNFSKRSHFGYKKVIKTSSLACSCNWDSERLLEVKLGIRDFSKRSHFGCKKVIKTSSWVCSCNFDSERELEVKLEAEIMEFMKGSDKPGAFPTKAELVEAGRRDLVDAIVSRGGWLSMGWESEEEEMEIQGVGDAGEMSKENGEMGSDFDENVERVEEDSSWDSTSFSHSHSPSSSGRSFETSDEGEDSGVEGILARLEKERNLSFGVNLKRQQLSRYNSEEWLMEASGDVVSDHLRKSRRFSSDTSREGILTSAGDESSPSKTPLDVDGSWSSLKLEMVKTLTIQGATFSNPEYEASQVPFAEDQFHGAEDTPVDGIIAIKGDSSEVLAREEDYKNCDIRTRLHQLELQLASTLSSLRSKSEELIPKAEGSEALTEIQELSDALEFQETEIINAKNSLRSIRAKLAVLEGKMTLAIIDARKTIDEKQRKIDSVHRAMQLLRTTSIVWHNSASEVLLVGSFDGWTTQRRMKKSSSGVFSLELKLYPGRYEIKFIVDGVWKVDPLRPIVKNGGYENNLFIVT